MKKLVFIGAGSIAEAMISGIGESKLLPGNQIWVTNKQNTSRLRQLATNYCVNISYDHHELFKDADVIVLAMKPKDAAAAIAELKPYFSTNTLLISVLAGVSIAAIERAAGKSLPIARAMPNTSAAVQKSATAVSFNEKVNLKQQKIVRELFETVGMITIVNETQLDAVTGLSGSGPAYIYYLVEAMEASAVDIGLETETAKKLIVQTLIGAAKMLDESNKKPSELRMEVTSPGGTTEAGIKILEQNQVKEALISCIKEATQHSKKLGTMMESVLMDTPKSF